MTMLILKIAGLVLAGLLLGAFGVASLVASLIYCDETGNNLNPQAPFSVLLPLGFIFIAPEKIDEWLCQAGYSPIDMRISMGLMALYGIICLIVGVRLGCLGAKRWLAGREKATQAKTAETDHETKILHELEE